MFVGFPWHAKQFMGMQQEKLPFVMACINTGSSFPLESINLQVCTAKQQNYSFSPSNADWRRKLFYAKS